MLLPKISGVKVAPCLLPKISGVEVTPSITSVESSEQFLAYSRTLSLLGLTQLNMQRVFLLSWLDKLLNCPYAHCFLFAFSDYISEGCSK